MSVPATEIPFEHPVTAADRVAFEIQRALEQRRLIPGQRLIETELAIQVGVGRNAVREAIQRLAAKGIVDLSPNRSPAIRKLEVDETLEVLELAEELFGLLARVAARNFRPELHGKRMRAVLKQLTDLSEPHDRGTFSSTRREFYRALLEIGRNRELHRHFAAIQMQIIYVQYESARLDAARRADYLKVAELVAAGDARRAEAAARGHVKHVRKLILALASNEAREP